MLNPHSVVYLPENSCKITVFKVSLVKNPGLFQKSRILAFIRQHITVGANGCLPEFILCLPKFILHQNKKRDKNPK
jgi:hypothetical protein